MSRQQHPQNIYLRSVPWAFTIENTRDYQVHESKLYTRACMTLEEASDETETVSLGRVCINYMNV